LTPASARPPEEAPQRLAGLDAAKAVAIASVVLIHAAPVAMGPYRELVVGGLARIGVPCFLVITGLLTGLRASSRARLFQRFLRFLRLHVVYGLAYWAVDLLHRGPPEVVTAKSVLLHFGAASWPGQYYFVVLIQVFFVAALLPPGFWRWRGTLPLALLAAVAGLAWLVAAPGAAARLGLPRWLVAGLTTESAGWLWFHYFALGALLGERMRCGLPTPIRDARIALCALAGAAVLAAAGLPAVPDWGDPRVYPYARLSIFLAVMLCAVALPSLASRSVPAWIQRIGSDSFGIFVLNPAILWGLAALWQHATDPWTSWLHAAATIALAVPLTRGMRRVAPALLP
jgi:peptidoglycan/LPS O-acetylase OafA/YrhL